MKKKDPLLWLIMIVVGIFTYFAAFKGLVYIFLIPIILVLLVLWIIATILVTKKMIAKNRGNDDFFFSSASMISDTETELINGALAVTKDEIVFYKRKGYLGGVVILWSCFVSQINSYSFGKVDDKHNGITINLNNSSEPKRFASLSIGKKEEGFRKTIGWE